MSFYFIVEDLKKKLEDWIAPNPKIKLLRHKEREGLIRARLTGAKTATGQVSYVYTNLRAFIIFIPFA